MQQFSDSTNTKGSILSLDFDLGIFFITASGITSTSQDPLHKVPLTALCIAHVISSHIHLQSLLILLSPKIFSLLSLSVRTHSRAIALLLHASLLPVSCCILFLCLLLLLSSKEHVGLVCMCLSPCCYVFSILAQ